MPCPGRSHCTLRPTESPTSRSVSADIIHRFIPVTDLTAPLYVIPEGAGTVNPYDEDRLGVVCCSSVEAGSRQPADGVNGGAPAAQRGRMTLGSLRAEAGWQRRRDGCLSMASFRQVVGWWQLHRQQPLAVGSPRGSGAGHPFAAQGGMELCGRSRAGSIKRATTPPGGGHDTHEHAPGCARAVHRASAVAGARQRTWPSRRP